MVAIVKDSGDDPFLTTRALLDEEGGRVGMVGFGMGEETTSRILAHPSCIQASDGSSLATYGALAQGNPHPRSYGTFARVLGKHARGVELVLVNGQVVPDGGERSDNLPGHVLRGELTPSV